MTRQIITDRLLDILTSGTFAPLAICRSSVTDETSLLNDVGLDSLQLLDLVVAIEHGFGFRISAQALDLEMFDRFGRVVDFVAAGLASVSRDRGGSHAEKIA